MVGSKGTPLKVTPEALSEKKKSPSLLNPATFVTIYVGIKEDRQKFSIHKDFATHHSPVLKAAFDSGFVEGQTQTYVLEDTTEEAVRLLVHWMYTQTLDISSVAEKRNETNISLVQLWVLADKLLVPSLQNQVLRMIDRIGFKSELVATNAIHEIYRTTAVDSSLRRLILHQCAYRVSNERFTSKPSQFPNEMLLELAVLFIKEYDSGLRFKQNSSFDISKLEVSED